MNETVEIVGARGRSAAGPESFPLPASCLLAVQGADSVKLMVSE